LNDVNVKKTLQNYEFFLIRVSNHPVFKEIISEMADISPFIIVFG